jgi:hypothetical protein
MNGSCDVNKHDQNWISEACEKTDVSFLQISSAASSTQKGINYWLYIVACHLATVVIWFSPFLYKMPATKIIHQLDSLFAGGSWWCAASPNKRSIDRISRTTALQDFRAR